MNLRDILWRDGKCWREQQRKRALQQRYLRLHAEALAKGLSQAEAYRYVMDGSYIQAAGIRRAMDEDSK